MGSKESIKVIAESSELVSVIQRINSAISQCQPVIQIALRDYMLGEDFPMGWVSVRPVPLFDHGPDVCFALLPSERLMRLLAAVEKAAGVRQPSASDLEAAAEGLAASLATAASVIEKACAPVSVKVSVSDSPEFQAWLSGSLFCIKPAVNQGGARSEVGKHMPGNGVDGFVCCRCFKCAPGVIKVDLAAGRQGHHEAA